jgi:glycosyltransferase involved in cell wall biosynthesis
MRSAAPFGWRRSAPAEAADRPSARSPGSLSKPAALKAELPIARTRATTLVKNACPIEVDTPLAHILMTDYGGAFGLYGFVHSRTLRLASIKLKLKQKEFSSSAQKVILQTGIFDPNRAETLEPGFVHGLDAGFYVSSVFPNMTDIETGLAYVEATVTWNNNTETVLTLCSARVERIKSEKDISFDLAEDIIGIAMTTYNPNPNLFARQIESIKNQSHSKWFCLISDDGSDVSHLNYILRTVEGDKRFAVRKNQSKLGLYRNFERALAGLPSWCRYVTFCDQDDIWKSNKLSQQLIELSSQNAECVYSDMEIVRTDGTMLSRSFWVYRKRPYGSLSGLLLANEVTGMTMLFNRTLVELALPFPATPNLTYHDHWVALLAESYASLRYISAPLVQYIQHGGNHTGALTPPERARDVLRRGLRRLSKIVSMPFAKIKDPMANRAKLSEAVFWTALEMCRLRVIAFHIFARQRNGQTRKPVQKLIKVSTNFDIKEILTANICWRDRYRRAYVVEIVMGRVLKSIIASYVVFRKLQLK